MQGGGWHGCDKAGFSQIWCWRAKLNTPLIHRNFCAIAKSGPAHWSQHRKYYLRLQLQLCPRERWRAQSMHRQHIQHTEQPQSEKSVRSRSGLKAQVSGRRSGRPQKVSMRRASRERIAHTSQYRAAGEGAQMKIEYFVKTKFIPEHVQHKSRGAQTQYQAVLKHILRPETVDRIFASARSKARLTSVPDWPYLDDVRLCDLNAEHVRKILLFASSRHYSWQTVHYIKNVIGAIITHARQEGYFNSRSPVSEVKLPARLRRPEEYFAMWQRR